MPTSQNGRPRPSEKANSAPAPSVALLVLPIQRRMPVSTGPVQGAAMSAAHQAQKERAAVADAAELGETVG